MKPAMSTQEKRLEMSKEDVVAVKDREYSNFLSKILDLITDEGEFMARDNAMWLSV